MTFEKNKDKVIVMDVDGALSKERTKNQSYSELEPNIEVIKKLKEYYDKGYYIILYTSRNMNTYNGNLGLINANTAPVMIDWLNKNNVQYHEIHFGKPWCGFNGFYVDDKAIRPSEFLKYSEGEIKQLIDVEKLT